jgi:hypothetical protein
VGTSTSTLTFTDNAGEVDGSTQQVALSGKSVQASSTTSIISFGPNPALVGQAVTVSFLVLPPSGDTLTPSGTVTVKASTGESCTAPVTAVSCSLVFAAAATRTITASYSGDTNFVSSSSSVVQEQVFDFTLSVSPASETIPAGHLATYTLTVSSLNGFIGTVSLACAPGPPHSTCSVSPNSMNLSNSSAEAGGTINLENKGTYTFTIVASDGNLRHTVAVTLTVK